MKRILFILMALMVLTSVEAKKCHRCNGKRRIQTQFAVGSYGVSNKKIKCSICGKWIYAGVSHWDDCPVCGGTGEVGGSSSSSSSDRMDIYQRYLTTAEYQDFTRWLQVAMQGQKVYATCPTCQGKKYCLLCKGTGLAQYQHPYDTELGMLTKCPNCGGTCACMKCSGKGQVLVNSDKGKQEANKRLQYYAKLVQQRQKQRK